jgi:CheY-like chemotaxis protein
MSHEPVVILLAEDDDGHAQLVQRNLKRAGVTNEVQRVEDGQLALDYVRCAGTFSNRTRHGPLLVLLDINMPRIDGIEVLRQIKADPGLATIPVIMLTTTDNPREVEACYQLGCSVYVTKPVEYEPFVEAIKRLGLFLQVVRVPRENHLPIGAIP